jgi:hypothetical protein
MGLAKRFSDIVSWKDPSYAVQSVSLGFLSTVCAAVTKFLSHTSLHIPGILESVLALQVNPPHLVEQSQSANLQLSRMACST